jgi:hypothetical protein
LIVATLLLALSSLGLTQNTVNSTGISVPHLIKFSGVVKDGAGAPKTGVVGVTFAFYKDQQGGTPLWLETQNAQADASGRYTVMLGATKSDGLPMEFFTSNEARWVGVQPQGQNEQPRVLLVSAPYALKASDAETLGGKPASAYVLSAPGTGSTTTSKTAALDAPVNHSVNPPLGGTGTPNHIAKWKTKAILENSGIIEGSAGNVGIGAAPSNFQLQVTAPNQLGDLIQGPFSGVGAGLDLQTTGTGGKGWEILATGKTAAQGPNKLNVRDLSTATDVLTIAPGGFVGIDTANPVARLHVVSSTTQSAVLGINNTNNGTGAVTGQNFGTATFASGVVGAAIPTSGLTYGVNGVNNSTAFLAAGVEGDEFAASGKTFGTIGTSASPNGTGLYGLAIGPSQTGGGVGCCPVGVWGDTVSNLGGAAGLVGTADDGRAIYLQNNSQRIPTAFATNSAGGIQPVLTAGGSGGFCNIDTTGHLACDHALSVSAAVDNGQRQVALYAVESPQNWFEDFGSGQLASGTAKITLERTFAEAVNTGVTYHVFLTPRNECEGLYVGNTTASGFEVHELRGGHSNVTFDYRIVALRRGLENVRLEDMTERLKKAEAFRPMATPGQRFTMPARPARVAPSKHDVAEISAPK